MTETVRCALLFTLTCAIVAYGAENVTDSVPAALTVYRNPQFFRKLRERTEREDVESAEEEDGKEDVYNNNNEEFYDFDDEYRYPGEPKKPNPPAEPDEFRTFFDESPEFQPEPRDISSSDRYRSGDHANDRSEESDNELNDYGERETESENSEHDDESHYEEPRKKKYFVTLERDLKRKAPEKLFEESKDYYSPVYNHGIPSFHYPSSYEDSDYYGYDDDRRPVVYTDRKKGTREYLKDHSAEEIEEPGRSGNLRAGTKHIFKAVSKIGIKTLKPLFYVPHYTPKFKAKYKFVHKPRKLVKSWRIVREVPDDSAYVLSSDYDSDFELF